RFAVALLEQRCARIIRTGSGSLTPRQLGPTDVLPELLGARRALSPLDVGGAHDAQSWIGGLLRRVVGGGGEAKRRRRSNWSAQGRRPSGPATTTGCRRPATCRDGSRARTWRPAGCGPTWWSTAGCAASVRPPRR